MDTDEQLSIYISEDSLALLRKLDYPCSERVLASATTLEDEGIQLTGNRRDFETLAGFVAGDANHADRRATRKLAMLYDISEALESALEARARFR